MQAAQLTKGSIAIMIVLIKYTYNLEKSIFVDSLIQIVPKYNAA